MEKAVVGFDSGQRATYLQNVVPLERRLKRNGKVNWAVCLLILVLSAVAGVIIGYFLLPTILGLFAGLLGGSVVGIVLLVAFYFLRSAVLSKTKSGINTGISTCEEAYKQAYSIPAGAIECSIIASDFLSSTYFGPSLAYARDDGAISVIAKNFQQERNEIRYSSETLIAYVLLGDSNILLRSEEGHILLSAEAKGLFLASGLPLMEPDTSLIIELNDKVISSSQRRGDHVSIGETAENAYWGEAEKALDGCLSKEGK